MNDDSDKTQPPQKINSLRILGIRGIPASHGGFETFAQHLAEYLTKKEWQVTVYCQVHGSGPIVEDDLAGIRLIKIPEQRVDAIGTMRFDWKSIRHAANEKGLTLTLGYNTALFNLWFRFKGIKNIINMDGFEWKRTKWSLPARIWFYINDWSGCFIGHHLIADHPVIEKHLATRRSKKSITMVPYGAALAKSPSKTCIAGFGIEPKQYALCVARAEPENSLLEIVRAFSVSERTQKLVVLGKFCPKQNKYHERVLHEANDSVLFLGGVYNKDIVESLRYHCSLYIHGHTVGGTNPSLVESLGAGAPVLANDNRFNRWVAGDGAEFFRTEVELKLQLDKLLSDVQLLKSMSKSSVKRFNEAFTWNQVLEKYESLLSQFLQ